MIIHISDLMENKIMDWSKILAFATLIAVLGMTVATAQEATGALSLTNLKITPQPVVAGETFNLTFQLFNSYVNPLSNVNIQLTASNPILNVSPSSSDLIQDIGSGNFGGGNIRFTYKLHVPSTLQAGEYTVYMQASYDSEVGIAGEQENLPGQTTDPINFYVYGIPNIQLVAVPSSQLLAGAPDSFEITAINTGTDTARNVSMTFLNSTDFIPSGAPTINLGIMSVGAQVEDTATLIASPSLRAGNVTIPIRLKYTAGSGINYSMITNITVAFVTPKPDIVASIEDAIPNQLAPGANQTLTVLIQNNGYGTAKNLTLKFLSSPPLTVTSSASSYFIGTLAAGAKTTEQIQLTASRDANKTLYNLPVSISYSEITGVSNQSIRNIPVRLQNASIFNITAVSGTLIPGGTNQPLALVIKNIGNEPAEQVTLSLQTIYPLTPENPNYYINSLAPGQSVNATFFVSTSSQGDNGTYPITVYEQWKQPNGFTTQQYSSFNNYYAEVSTSGGIGSYLVPIVIVLIIVAGAVYYKRIYIKKNAKKKG
jgi:hypothetical protein